MSGEVFFNGLPLYGEDSGIECVEIGIDELPEGQYVVGELCPACEGECDGCTTCWDEAVVEHACE